MNSGDSTTLNERSAKKAILRQEFNLISKIVPHL